MLVIVFAFFLAYQSVVLPGLVTAQEDETTVRQRILKDYDKTLSPVLFQTSELSVLLWLNVLRIRGLDETKGEFILEGILATLWMDERLSFESDTVLHVRFDPDDVWLPHINVLNRVEKDEQTLNPKVFVMKYGAGWGPRFVFRTSCIPNLKFFPFDKHNCDIIIISISDEGDILPVNYTKPQVTLTASVFTRHMVENNLWRLVESSSVSKMMEVDIDANRYGGVFSFEIERTMPLIALGILCPCLVSVLLLLTTFWMRAGAVTRTGMSATSILVSAGNLYTIGRILPVSGNTTPIIVEYVACALILSLISTLQSIIVSVLSRCSTQPPLSYAIIIQKIPKWILIILALVPDAKEAEVVDQSFMFSELVESDNAETSQSDRNNSRRKTIRGPWEKHVILFDRIVFHLFGLVLCLLIVSILFTE